jgi:hypothetical protein
MEIRSTRVYGLEESIRSSHYPKTLEPFLSYDDELKQEEWGRARKLGKAPSGSGHDCYLKGINVQADWRAPIYMWLQIQRYHFFDIVSSQSKMHMILHMDLDKQCNKYVVPEAKAVVRKLIEEHQKNPSQENFQKLISNVPEGLYLTARITTNYLQLKTMLLQRRKHKLEEWREYFVGWCKSLPTFLELTNIEVS